ncbi:bifunctional methylenetetrahydrofolate dehydrogenase/methenyltetrahydrofolate cyclohydrolase FolD [Sandaracinobacteroides saxicola]|uniref:Bifunctional protein FolD n=1 Tax=Sandaracinobacteroides saxicola TaxID=2759707 RepID=A0A7G5IJ60_9SPHN|nr:bifunctional methylenetetrahydrofolate dehydrogenase/methenyltetrahydrofolate cyclohydrolase FolD [Sandaracinobacteroides saxicola]QMW23402.1 bifunctional methylenetetrahydrofolate dehydrogenase/methenyltetrahydrofolate cyclohydrolase FolD [Sandaracinobacteroides saxicola]
MTATLIDGKAIAATLRADVAAAVTARTAAGHRAPCLAVVLVGDDPASAVYVRSKARACAEAGLRGLEHRLPATTTETDLLALVDALNTNDSVDGILVQLPLPPQCRADAVIARIDPAKDVDGFHPLNAGRLAAGLPGLVPCTPLGCLRLLTRTLGGIAGAEALVIGRSTIVGRPMASLLINESATVTIAHSRSRDLPALTARADIVIAAVGRPEMIRGPWLKPGATVIDVGINRVASGDGHKLVGDVAFAEAMEVAGAVTPVPGGVGPMTIACLLENTLTAATARAAT